MAKTILLYYAQGAQKFTSKQLICYLYLGFIYAPECYVTKAN